MGNPEVVPKNDSRKTLLFPCFGRHCLRLFRFTSFGLYRRGNEHDEYNREDQEKREQDQQDFHAIRPFGGHLTTRINKQFSSCPRGRGISLVTSPIIGGEPSEEIVKKCQAYFAAIRFGPHS